MASEEVALLVGPGGHAHALPQGTLAGIGLRERADLQEWLIAHPQLVEPGLLVVTSEFDRWEIKNQKVPDRLDVLLLDEDGALVVAELKRDQAADTVEMQALKYASYCSQLTVDDVVEEYARFHGLALDDARRRLLAHAPPLADGELGRVRIRLVAGGFGPAVTSVVLWLREYGVDIGCVEITVRPLRDGEAVVSSRLILPLPEAEDYLVRRRRREQDERVKRETTRGMVSIRVLSEAGLIEEGIVLTLGLDTLSSAWREVAAEQVNLHPEMARARWTGESIARSLRWEYDGEIYSPTGLTKRILELGGLAPGSIAGPDHWLLPDGRSMYRAALDVRGAATA